jgi:hypothetical protein
MSKLGRALIGTNAPKPKGAEKGRSYDAFEHLCRSLFKTGDDLLGMLTAYFDDSATEDVATVAGYVGSVVQWDRFKIEWQKLLDEYGLKPCTGAPWMFGRRVQGMDSS